MKKDCSLFKQKGLTINKKEKNLNSLKNTQLDFKSLADMENLEGAIQEYSSISENDNESIDGLSNEENVEAEMEKVMMMMMSV